MDHSLGEAFHESPHRSLSLDMTVNGTNGRNSCSDEDPLAIRRSQSVDNLGIARKPKSDLSQSSSDVQGLAASKIQTKVSKYGRPQPSPHLPPGIARSKENGYLADFFGLSKLSRQSIFSRIRSPAADRPPAEECNIYPKHPLRRLPRLVSGVEESYENPLQENHLYDDPRMLGGGKVSSNRDDYTIRSTSQLPTLRYKRCERPFRERSGSPESRRFDGAMVSEDLELFRTNTLKAIKRKQSKIFKERFGSLRISDKQWMTTFDIYRGIYFRVADQLIKSVDSEEINGLMEEMEFGEVPGEILMNTINRIMESIKYRYPRRGTYKSFQLEVWLIHISWKIFRDEYIRSGVGSWEAFKQKWEKFLVKYPDMTDDLRGALDASEGLPRKWIDPNTNAKNCRAAMENLFENQLELKGRVLLASGVEPQDYFIAISAAFPDVGAILERIHILDKKLDRVLYGMPVGKKSQAFLSSQELDVREYFQCDEINLSWRSIFAAVDFGLSDRSTGAQPSKSTVKAKLYYDLILEASCMSEQSWLHEHLSKCTISQEIVDFQLVGRKWKTLREFIKSAEPKAQRIADLCQAPKPKNAEGSSLRRRNVRQSSRSENFQESIAPGDSLGHTPLSTPNLEVPSNATRKEKMVTEHLLSFIRHIRQKPRRKVALAFLVDRKTVLVLLPCFIALSAVFTGVSLIASVSDPNTSNFYEQLSTLFQMLFSLYCLMVPLIRASNPIAWSFWLSLAVVMSAAAGVLSVALFYHSGKASISFSFVSGTAQIIATMLLIEGVDEVVRRPRMEFAMPAVRDVSLGSEDEMDRARHRSRDEEALEFGASGARPEPIFRDVFYRGRER